jgi:hypothetical protein
MIHEYGALMDDTAREKPKNSVRNLSQWNLEQSRS